MVRLSSIRSGVPSRWVQRRWRVWSFPTFRSSSASGASLSSLKPSSTISASAVSCGRCLCASPPRTSGPSSAEFAAPPACGGRLNLRAQGRRQLFQSATQRNDISLTLLYRLIERKASVVVRCQLVERLRRRGETARERGRKRVSGSMFLEPRDDGLSSKPCHHLVVPPTNHASSIR